MAESRTQKSLKNAQVALIFYFIQLVLGFFSRKAFFDYLGSEVLGLNTTASNLLGFLNLAELGVSAAVSFFLYQPLYDKNYDKLNKLVSIQGWLYRRIAFFIIGSSIVLMLFFPIIFSKSPLSLWYPYSTFTVLLFSSLLGYFYNYKQIVLYADQKNYLIQRYFQSIIIIKTICQIIAISNFKYPFIAWLILEVIGTIVSTLLISHILKKEYPWLKTDISKGKAYIKEYPEVLKKTGQAFFHRIGGIILNQSSPLILYGFTSLTTVALYGNYVLIVSKLTILLGTIFNSTSAAVGNLIASKDSKKIIRIFWELYDTRLCFSIIVLLCLYHLINPFISVWLGDEYCFDKSFVILYLILNSISLTRITVENYVNAYGLFSDIWAPLVEAVLNISLSIILGFYYGINGVILGITISQIVIILLWKPYFLFTKAMHLNAIKYFGPIIIRYSISILLFIITDFLYSNIFTINTENIKDFIISSIAVVMTTGFIVFISFNIFFKGVRDFCMRMISLVQNH